MWKHARKKPIVIRFREVIPTNVKGMDVLCEEIFTREGAIYGFPDIDFVIEGVRGELYPIKKDIFYETYEVLEDES